MVRLEPPARRALAGAVALLLLAFSASGLFQAFAGDGPLRLSGWGNGAVVDCSGSNEGGCFREVPVSHLAARTALLAAAALAAWGAWSLAPRALAWAAVLVLVGWGLHAAGYVVPQLLRPVPSGRTPLWWVVALGYPLAAGMLCVKALKLAGAPASAAPSEAAAPT